jgi:hypothetical protein
MYRFGIQRVPVGVIPVPVLCQKQDWQKAEYSKWYDHSF